MIRQFRKKQILARARIKVNRILPFLESGQRIIDVGSGNGGVSHLLMQRGCNVKPVDIGDKSFFEEAKPQIADGSALPFESRTFDTALLLTVLHHTSNPEAVLEEAKRVASNIIVMEDVYDNTFQKYLTFFADSMVNWEFKGHPHTNKKDSEWRKLFEQKGLTLVRRSDHPNFLWFFKQVTYLLKVR